jgi:hypothetical protein
MGGTGTPSHSTCSGGAPGPSEIGLTEKYKPFEGVPVPPIGAPTAPAAEVAQTTRRVTLH